MWLEGIPFIPWIQIFLFKLHHLVLDSNQLIEDYCLENILKILKTIKIQKIDLWRFRLPQKLKINETTFGLCQCTLKKVLGCLLQEHIVVAFPSLMDIVICINSAKPAVRRVTMSSQKLSTFRDRFVSEPCRLAF